MREIEEIMTDLKGGFDSDPQESSKELERLNALCEEAFTAMSVLYVTNNNLHEVVDAWDEDPFRVLNKINVNEHIEKKNGLSYLSWAWAWDMLMSLYPESETIINRPENGFPYWTDGKTCWVDVAVKLKWNGGERTRAEIFPIMDYKNNSIPLERLTSFNVNTALQRAWTKCIARHGLGFYIYAGEDLPKDEAEAKKAELATDEQIQRVQELYTTEELGKMLKRLKLSNPVELTKEQADKMIVKRDMSMVAAQVESY